MLSRVSFELVPAVGDAATSLGEALAVNLNSFGHGGCLRRGGRKINFNAPSMFTKIALTAKISVHIPEQSPATRMLPALAAPAGRRIQFAICFSCFSDYVHCSLEGGNLEEGSLQEGNFQQGSLKEGCLEDCSLEEGSLEECNLDEGIFQDGKCPTATCRAPGGRTINTVDQPAWHKPQFRLLPQ
jgi:hypothetical protein